MKPPVASKGHMVGEAETPARDLRNRESSVRRVAAADLAIGLICADRDGNRVRIDSIDKSAGKLSYHYLNDELRVQEGVQEPAIHEFLAQGWRLAAFGRL